MKHTQKSCFLTFLLFCALCVSAHTQLKAQFITIPDANFRAKLQILFPACFGGTGGIQLNTACPAVTSATIVNVSYGNIANLTGIGAFVSLQRLDCNNNQLTSLPALPTNLTYLDCESNQLASPLTLPTNLTYLSCGNNQLTSLPTLPASLLKLYCSANQLTSLPALPTSLQWLYCENNQLTSLPALNAGLQQLYCTSNQLISLPVLPTNLMFLYARLNQLTNLPTLTANLLELDCGRNQLTSLPALPASLAYLDCSFNQLTALPTLFASLGQLFCRNNQLDFADLEAINPKPSIVYSAGPQNYTILPAIVSVATGGTLSINGTIGGTLNVYKWFKDNVLIVGATSATFTKTSFVLADAGIYRCEVTSTFVGVGTTTGISISSSNVTVCSTITFNNTTVTNGVVGTPYTLNASATNATSYTVSPALPAGLLLNTATGAISGTPTLPLASATYTVTATQGTCSATQGYTFAINCPTIVISPATFVSGTLGTSYSQTLTQTGLTGTATWFVSVGTLPTGLSIAITTGVISGTPTIVGTFSFTINVTNGTGCIQTKVYSIVVCPTLVFGTTTASGATVGTAYSLNAGVTGNTTTVIYGILPILPAGLSLNTTTGLISGTPTTATASASYIVTATQGTCNAIQSYTFAVACPNLAFAIGANYNGVVGTAYSLNAGVTGNTATVIYGISPILPAGLSLNTTSGLINGTPTTATASASYTVTATQGTCSATQSYTFAIITPNPTTALDNSLANQIKVSPNPSIGDFNIDFGSINTVKSSVRVYDAQGKTVYSSENNSNLMTISLENSASGIYLLEVETSKGRIFKRLAKK